ncbi:MAG: HD domain-containing protein [Bacteriovorax sp.]|jgi:uncharacterized protein
MNNFEILFEKKIQNILGELDPAHDLSHVKRVVSIAKRLSQLENAKMEIVLPSAWLHDLVNLPKDHPERASASKLAASDALSFLSEISYPSEHYKAISHAIEAHSFSANIVPRTIEAKVVQDADRLDGLGAIGLARLFSISTQLNRPFYSFADPFAQNRVLNDKQFAIDHIEIKLKRVVELMNTESAQIEAKRRFNFVVSFLKQLQSEID